jgi:hypothetical protein
MCLTRIAIMRILGACNQEIEIVNFTLGIISRRIITIGIINIITIGSNIIPGGKVNKRVFYYSVELFCLIGKCVRRIFFIFSGKEFF